MRRRDAADEDAEADDAISSRHGQRTLQLEVTSSSCEAAPLAGPERSDAAVRLVHAGLQFGRDRFSCARPACRTSCR